MFPGCQMTLITADSVSNAGSLACFHFNVCCQTATQQGHGIIPCHPDFNKRQTSRRDSREGVIFTSMSPSWFQRPREIAELHPHPSRQGSLSFGTTIRFWSWGVWRKERAQVMMGKGMVSGRVMTSTSGIR